MLLRCNSTQQRLAGPNKPWLPGESMQKPTGGADASWALLAARQLPIAMAVNLR